MVIWPWFTSGSSCWTMGPLERPGSLRLWQRAPDAGTAVPLRRSQEGTPDCRRSPPRFLIGFQSSYFTITFDASVLAIIDIKFSHYWQPLMYDYWPLWNSLIMLNPSMTTLSVAHHQLITIIPDHQWAINHVQSFRHHQPNSSQTSNYWSKVNHQFPQ